MSDVQPLTPGANRTEITTMNNNTPSPSSPPTSQSQNSQNLIEGGGGSGSITTTTNNKTEMSPLTLNENINIGQQQSHNNYRHSRAYRHFKNPPQPHMCIRTTTVLGDELFINVLSWTRIVIPQEPSDPIPLYGGMRVQAGRPRMPLVYAVMANPEVLKDSGRHSKDPEERRAMVELMCDFVEAMNPDVKLTRNALILKDRDISGELKDVWNAVQAQRDREREEQITQQQRQQQQQHYHNVTTQQLFPKATDQSEQLDNNLPTSDVTMKNNEQLTSNNTEITNDNKILYMEFGPSTTTTTTTPQLSAALAINNDDNNKNMNFHNNDDELINSNEILAQSAINNVANNINFTFSDKENEKLIMENNCYNNDTTTIDSNNLILNSEFNTKNHINNIDTSTTTVIKPVNNSLQNESSTTTVAVAVNNKNLNSTNQIGKVINQTIQNHITATPTNTNTTTTPITNNSNHTITTTTNNTNPISNITTSTTTNEITTMTTTATATIASTTATTTTTTTSTPTKRGSFLPNGCIFPRFKNNKHKEKEKEKDKEKEHTKSSSNKEKTLLNSLKKVTSQSSKSSHHHLNEHKHNQQFDKNFCMNLENEVEKLDLNKLDGSGNNDVLIKVKINTTDAK